MNQNLTHAIHRFEAGQLSAAARPVVQEYPLRLTVNDRELATLIASPHQPNFLVAGFLYNQGFVTALDEIQTLGVCHDFGDARGQLTREIPERLTPTLTSGCGAGISFNLPQSAASAPHGHPNRIDPEAVFRLMRELQRRAEQYRSHGGIHSAAVGDADRLLLYAEDLGRHNTLDRLAGEALFKGIELRGKLLVTSGRVSTEMVAKAVRLGIVLIASRTSPTDKAIELCAQAGITLIGYLRGTRMEIYSHPEQLQLSPTRETIPGVTGVILAGGESRRMGSDKSLLPIDGARFIDHLYRSFAELFDEVLIVTNSPGLYADLPCRKVTDIYRAQGSLAGIHAGLEAASQPRIFVAACDMPLLNPTLVRRICAQARDHDVTIPRSHNGHEPLHAVYAKSCLPSMTAELAAGRRRIVSFFPQVRVSELHAELWRDCDPQELSFRNINTPEEYFALRGARSATDESPSMAASQPG